MQKPFNIENNPDLSSFQLFNVFGMLRVSRQHISALATGILPNGSSVERTVNTNLDDPIQKIAVDEVLVILFAAMVQPNQQPRVAIQQLSKRIGGPDVLNEPAVQNVLNVLFQKLQS